MDWELTPNNIRVYLPNSKKGWFITHHVVFTI